MKIFHVKNSLLCRIINVDAIVLYPFIFFHSKVPDEILISHEMVHVEQIKREGMFKFYFKYLFEYLVLRCKKIPHSKAYHSISFEIEAYEKQKKKSSIS
jgi:hypothetical protein